MGFWSGNTKMVYSGVERNGCRRGEENAVAAMTTSPQL